MRIKNCENLNGFNHFEFEWQANYYEFKNCELFEATENFPSEMCSNVESWTIETIKYRISFHLLYLCALVTPFESVLLFSLFFWS